MKGTVITQKEIAEGIFDLRIRPEKEIRPEPGQFLLLYPKDEAKLLPRPISICASETQLPGASDQPGLLRLVYRVQGGGTKEFSALAPGDELRLSAPKGTGFPMPREGDMPILLGGGIGIPPLLFLAQKLHGLGFDLKVLLGYRTPPYFLSDEFAEYGEVDLAVEGSSHPKLVTELLPELPLPGTVVYACGPLPMLRAIQAYALENGLSAWLSLEERMACGEGVCLGCMVNTKENEAHFGVPKARVCKDGPVFAAERIVFS